MVAVVRVALGEALVEEEVEREGVVLTLVEGVSVPPLPPFGPEAVEERVVVGEGVLDWVVVRVRVVKGEEVGVALEHTLRVEEMEVVMDAEEHTLGVCECVALTLKVPVGVGVLDMVEEGVWVLQEVELGVVVLVEESVAVPVGVPEAEEHTEELRELVAVSLKEPVGVGDWERVAVPEVVNVTVGVALPHSVTVPQNVIVPVGERLPLTDRLMEGDGEKVGVKLTLPLTVAQYVEEGVKL